MFVLLTIACAVSESLTATTDGGTWTVSIADAPEGRGITDLAATVTPATGVISAFSASMPDMGHVNDAGITDLGDGAFNVNVNFTMPGWWVLDGTVSGDAGDEDFRVELEVP